MIAGARVCMYIPILAVTSDTVSSGFLLAIASRISLATRSGDIPFSVVGSVAKIPYNTDFFSICAYFCACFRLP